MAFVTRFCSRFLLATGPSLSPSKERKLIDVSFQMRISGWKEREREKERQMVSARKKERE